MPQCLARAREKQMMTKTLIGSDEGTRLCLLSRGMRRTFKRTVGVDITPLGISILVRFSGLARIVFLSWVAFEDSRCWLKRCMRCTPRSGVLHSAKLNRLRHEIPIPHTQSIPPLLCVQRLVAACLDSSYFRLLPRPPAATSLLPGSTAWPK